MLLAGLRWDRPGAAFTCYAGTVFCALTLAGLALASWSPKPAPAL